MGEKEVTTEVCEAVANGTALPNKPDNAVSEKKDGVEEMCEDTKDDKKDKNKQVNVHKEDAEVSKDAKEGEEKDLKDDKRKEEEKAMEVDDKENKNEESEDESEEEEEDKVEEMKEVGSKKHATKKGGGEKGNNKKVTEEKKGKEKKEEPKTPAARSIERPVRERKSVERLVAVIEKDTTREFHIEKGRGTALKDIPNVAYKFSKKKATDDTLKLLHTVLYGRRGKAFLVKSNILRFSGFVWHEHEEKQKAKVQEKFEKWNKEKLFELCDLLDIPITKTTIKKEDVIAKLIDFLLIPHVTTSELLSEKDQPSKENKRKRPVKKSTPTTSSKKQKSKSETEEREGTPDTEEEEESNENGGPEKSEDNMSESESGEDSKKRKSSKKESASKSKTKTKASQTETSAKSEATPKTFSRKKKIHVVEEKPSTPKKSAASKEKTGKKGVKEKEKLNPSDEELKVAVCEILKEVDFNTATFTDILKLLGKRFNTELTPRKATIKLMIQEELTKLADVTDDEDEA